ncbi:hypothetical protein HKD37_01G000751 [Glycine soja]
MLLFFKPAQDQIQEKHSKQYIAEQEAKIYVVRQCVYIHGKVQLLIITLIMKLQVQYKQQLALISLGFSSSKPLSIT